MKRNNCSHIAKLHGAVSRNVCKTITWNGQTSVTRLLFSLTRPLLSWKAFQFHCYAFGRCYLLPSNFTQPLFQRTPHASRSHGKTVCTVMLSSCKIPQEPTLVSTKCCFVYGVSPTHALTGFPFL